jgi:hypothetical protein
MCVIVFKKAGVTLDFADIDKMFWQNSDGAGFAYYEGNKLHIKKGFMNVASLKKALRDTPAEYAIVLHFRHATSGKTNAHQTHPFILAPQVEQAKALDTATNRGAVFHNGVISGLGSAHFSDTCELATILSRLSQEQRKKTLAVIPGKFALLQGGKVWLFGHFETDEKRGIKCSNMLWDHNRYSYKGYSTCPAVNVRTEQGHQDWLHRQEESDRPDAIAAACFMVNQAQKDRGLVFSNTEWQENMRDNLIHLALFGATLALRTEATNTVKTRVRTKWNETVYSEAAIREAVARSMTKADRAVDLDGTDAETAVAILATPSEVKTEPAKASEAIGPELLMGGSDHGD